MQSLIYIKSALRSLRAQRMRTFLTTLGIIIGVMTVITMMSIIEGMNRYVYKVLGSMGSNTIYVQKYKWQMGPGGRKSRKERREIAKRKDFTKKDAEAIEELPSINLATLTQSTRGAQITYRDNKVEIQQIEGGTPKSLKILNYTIIKGRGFIETDIAFRRQIGIVGPYIVENLFKKGEDPLGKNVSIGPHKFTIIGILEEKGSFMGQNLDNKAIIPLTTLKKFIRKRWRYHIWGAPSVLAQVHPEYTVNEAQQEIEELLRARRGCRFNEENDFALNTQQMILDAYNKITGGIFMAMIGIASLALLVGGIGIMNIMLVSVVERTREIGIRMAVGAKRKDIMFQFLIEAIVLTLTGGIIGILLGFGFSKLISALTPLPASTPFWSILVGIGFSVGVGVFFGIYPARKASKLNPIEALRQE
ncbi:ABC transporter permease [candidate division WOR-3 bacterium]|nr:ABC transporter permease [candidate division WOR-3 bacterium]